MKIQCHICEMAEAKVLCCADEAALCWPCDTKIHGANKVASRHQRVPLSSSSTPMPKCDVCQETTGFFFCLEDRALLCRRCDVSIHNANAYVFNHQRFLLTGVKVGLETTGPCMSSTKAKSSPDKVSDTGSSQSVSMGSVSVGSVPFVGGSNEVFSGQTVAARLPQNTQLPFPGSNAAGYVPQAQFDQYLGWPGFFKN